MRIAVISDVHANIHALEAVAAAIERQAVDAILCLGDVVGYNANPRACIDWVRERADATVAGNHDIDVTSGDATVGTSSAARRAQAWTREALDPARARWLAGLPARVDGPGPIVAVHGCYLNDIYYEGYVTPTMIPANLDAVASESDDQRIALCGHTHQPTLAWARGGAAHVEPFAGEVTWPERAGAVLVNPGSVGQPRDGDPRAAFAVIDLEARRVALHRIEYDVGAAGREIRAAGLPDSLALRLEAGR